MLDYKAYTRTLCDIALQRTCLKAVQTCAHCKICLGIQIFQQRKFILMLIANIFAKNIYQLTHAHANKKMCPRCLAGTFKISNYLLKLSFKLEASVHHLNLAHQMYLLHFYPFSNEHKVYKNSSLHSQPLSRRSLLYTNL